MRININFEEDNIKEITISLVQEEGIDQMTLEDQSKVFLEFSVNPVVNALGEGVVKKISEEPGKIVLQVTSHENGERVLEALYRNFYILIQLCEGGVFRFDEEKGEQLNKELAEKIIEKSGETPIEDIKASLNLKVEVDDKSDNSGKVGEE